MLDLATIHEMAAEAAQEAAQEGREPYEYWDGEPIGPPFHFPFLGDYAPAGWRKRDGDDGDLFVDSSGLGEDDEAALRNRAWLLASRDVEIPIDLESQSPEQGGFGWSSAAFLQTFFKSVCVHSKLLPNEPAPALSA